MIIDGERYEKLLKFCRERTCTPYSVILTLCAITIFMFKGDDNFCLYTFSHGRTIPQLKRTVGCMQGAAPLFFDLSGSAAIGDYVSSCYLDYLETLSHARFSLGDQVLMAVKEAIFTHIAYNHYWFNYSVMDYKAVAEKTDLLMDMCGGGYTISLFYCSILDISGRR